MGEIAVSSTILLLFSLGCIWCNNSQAFLPRMHLLGGTVVLVVSIPLTYPLSRLSVHLARSISAWGLADGPNLLPLVPTLVIPLPLIVIACILGSLVFVWGRAAICDKQADQAERRSWKPIFIGGTAILFLVWAIVAASPPRRTESVILSHPSAESLTATSMPEANSLEKVLIGVRGTADVIGGGTKLVGYLVLLLSFLLTSTFLWMIVQEQMLFRIQLQRWLKVLIGSLVMVPLFYEPIYNNGGWSLIAAALILLLVQVSLLHLNLVSLRWARLFWVLPLLVLYVKSVIFVESLSFRQVIAIAIQE